MTMFQKYANLPDLDSAPDLYETPETPPAADASSTSRVQKSKLDPNISSPSSSTRDDDSEDDNDKDDRPIDRTHLRLEQARSQFQPARVDARGVDFSDRVTSRKYSYRTSTSRNGAKHGRRYVGRGAAENATRLGDFSDEEDEEGLERKIARLHREVEEVKGALAERRESKAVVSGRGARRRDDGDDGGSKGEKSDDENEDNDKDEDEDDDGNKGIAGDDDVQEKVTKLVQAVNSISVSRQEDILGPDEKLAQQIQQYRKASNSIQDEASQQNGGKTPTSSSTPMPNPYLISQLQAQHFASTSLTATQQQLQALSTASALDARLTELEKLLGISDFNLSEDVDEGTNDNSLSPPIDNPLLPTIRILKEQITLLNSAAPSLEAAGQRAQRLTSDIERFEAQRRAARLEREKEMERERERGRQANFGSLAGIEDIENLSGIGNTIAGGSGGGIGSISSSSNSNNNNGTTRLFARPDGKASDAGDLEHIAKINSLYGTMNTIETLVPTIPLLLERLQSLNVIHANAAVASETLDAVEKQQQEFGDELKQWRAALVKVQESMRENEDSNKGNARVVERWVKDLEGRIKTLSSKS